MNMQSVKWLLLIAMAVGLLSGFTSCSSDSGSDNPENINTGDGGGAGLTYDGPAAISSDVTEFKLNVWDNIVADNRCGSCHKQGGEGTGAFVRDDDINLAYQAALSRVDLENPINSLLVQRMNQGHNCWDNSNNVCATLMTDWIQAWADATGASATVISIQPVEPLTPPGESRNFPDSAAGFEQRIYDPILQPYCGRCHSENGSERQQQPYFASENLEVAYDAAKAKIDLNNAANSRFVFRLNPASHNNCWTDCEDDAETMRAAIQAFIDNDVGEPQAVNPDLVTSMALAFPATPDQGQSANTSGRFETNAIAKYEFKQLDQSDPTRVVDTSGVAPSLDLTLSGDSRFVSSWGVEFFGPSGRAQGRTADSAKLYDQITLTSEFSVEAWVIPANVTQDNTRRIISYSGGETERNFTLGQTLYDYDTLLRTTAAESDQNGSPLFSTPTAEEVLQASLQHVVVNWESNAGRQIYVNGELRSTDTDPLLGSGLSNWNNAFVLVLGNEAGAGNDTDWLGTLRFVAIHNRVLTPEQIQANFSAGVGQKYYMPFSIAHLVDIEGAYIVFEVERFDDYSYLFNEPFFTIVGNDTTSFADINIEGMRIGINGREAATGQAYAKMDITLTADDFQAAENNWLRFSSLGGDNNFPVAGTIVEAEKPLPETDEFFLTFDVIGNQSSSVDRDTSVPTNVSLPRLSYQQSDIGVKHFYEINELYSAITGVPKDNSLVRDKFNGVKTAMPSAEDPVGFGTSNQMAIAQLAAGYCEAAVGNASYRTALWPLVDFSAPLNGQDPDVLNPLLAGLTAHSFGVGHLDTQADPADLLTAVETLLDTLVTADDGSADNTEKATIAVCASVLSSAVATVQ